MAKIQKWKNIKVPEELWRIIKMAAAKNSRSLFGEIENKFK